MRRIAAFCARSAMLLTCLSVISACWGADQAEVVAPPGKGLIYVIAGDTGSFGGVLLSVNGKVVDTLSPNSYVTITVDPGRQHLSSAGSGVGSTDLSTVAGGVYYVQLRIGADGIPVFPLLSVGEAQALLSHSRKLREVGTAPSPVATSATVVPRSRAGAADSQPQRAGRAFEDKQAVAIILKGGAYTVAEQNQPMDTVPVQLDTKSTSAFGAEVEWRHPSGAAVGGEIFYFNNKWSIPGAVATGAIDTITYGVTAKYYFDIAHVVYPYLGLGLGYAVSSFTGDVTGTAAGFAYQGLAGIEFRYKYVGLNIQYKKLVADVKSSNSLNQTETNPMGGSGPLLGLAIHIPIH